MKILDSNKEQLRIKVVKYAQTIMSLEQIFKQNYDQMTMQIAGSNKPD